SLRAVNIATGRIDRTIPLDCDAGMVMTSTYANAADARRARYVRVAFSGAKPGDDQDVSLGLQSTPTKRAGTT
ncbi:hypothetical protein C3E98_032830, partial [Pseudomonas sp. MWU13-2625]